MYKDKVGGFFWYHGGSGEVSEWEARFVIEREKIIKWAWISNFAAEGVSI